MFYELSYKLADIPSQKILAMQMPEISSYPIYANPCAIMQCHTETREWLLSNFMQICSNSKVLTFYDFNYRECPFLNVQRISKKLLADWGISIFHFILYNLAKDTYVYLLVKMRFIDAYYFGNDNERIRDKRVHDILIYGYDMQRQILHIADNFYGGKYAFSQCTYEAMSQAIAEMLSEDESQGGFNGQIELIKYVPEGRPDLSIQRVLEALCDYLYCRPTGMWNIMEIRNFNRNRKWYFGLDCYEYMMKKVRETQYLDLRIQDFHLLWEHKKHLKSIFQYLLEKNYLYDDSIIQKMDNIVNNALCVRNLIIKAQMTNQNKIRECAINRYKVMKAEEDRLIHEIVVLLEKSDKERLMWRNQ